MVRSAFTRAHVSVWMDCDISATMELVERLKARASLLIFGFSTADHCQGGMPGVGAYARAEFVFGMSRPSEIVHKSSVNLGIAAATPRGLLVPNIKGAESLSLAELAGAINRVVATAREGRTQPADMAGGTFTITNIGVFGVDAGTPILNPGSPASCASVRSLAALGVGAELRSESNRAG
jgi:pyruvate dehydrogenase E2 component (dihydrolipoamide acetyltransferase)